MLVNFTNRASRIDGVDKVVHFGLQAFLQSYCIEAFAPFFAADEDEAVNEYLDTLTGVLGPNHGIDAEHVRALHRRGYLPLMFRALPEGTRVPLRVPSITVENTEPEFFWLPNYIETVLSAAIWQPSTSATIANEFRSILDDAAAKTGGDAAFVNWQLHDFSFRGMAGAAAAAASGAGHLLSFTGSDSLATIDWVRRYYPSEFGTDNGQVLGSIPATEHSVMCAGISESSELETFKRILDVHTSGNVSIVADTFDFWNVLLEILPALKGQIMARDGKVVIRPDSGDPADILCGTRSNPSIIREDKPATIAEDPAYFGAVQILWELAGGTVNDAGYKVIDGHFGLIYGDSITMDRARDITARLEALGFAAGNVVFGVGSFTYQYVTRDTFSSAIKATWAMDRRGGAQPAQGPRHRQRHEEVGDRPPRGHQGRGRRTGAHREGNGAGGSRLAAPAGVGRRPVPAHPVLQRRACGAREPSVIPDGRNEPLRSGSRPRNGSSRTSSTSRRWGGAPTSAAATSGWASSWP